MIPTDPVTWDLGQALRELGLISRLVYVAAPFRGKDPDYTQANIRLARYLARRVRDAGFLPVLPHNLGIEVTPEETHRQVALNLGIEVMFAVARAGGGMVVLTQPGGYNASGGVGGEVGMWRNRTQTPALFVDHPDGSRTGCHPFVTQLKPGSGDDTRAVCWCRTCNLPAFRSL